MTALILIAIFFNGVLAGISFDTALVKLPARKRIGTMAYVAFARGNDLGRGRTVYPVCAIAAGMSVIVATIGSFAIPGRGVRSVSMLHVLATCALAATVVHFIATGRAAPVMLSLSNTSEDERPLSAKLDRFSTWHTVRAVFQLFTFILLIVTVICL